MAKSILSLIIGASLLASSSFAALASEPLDSPFANKIKVAMKDEARSQADKDRDRNRLPVETLAFFGIKEDMKVLELVPGRGWYSRLLAAGLKDKGELYAAYGIDRLKTAQQTDPAFAPIKFLAETSTLAYDREKGAYIIPNSDLNIKDLDAVLTFRNYHNLGYEARTGINQAAFAALKPGGIYGVVDHTRRHMQAKNDENGRRVDPVLAIKEILAAGFEFVDYSDLHYHPDDELRFEVGRKTVTGNTDRFTLLFKKPMK